MSIHRRALLQALTAIGGASVLHAHSTPQVMSTADAGSRAPTAPQVDSELRMQIVMLAHPDMTALDLVGPQLIFATMPNTDVHIVWKNRSLITTDSGLNIVPSLTFDEAPRTPDLLFIPGGLKGTTAAMQDEQILEFVRQRGAQARWVTSVCTGALLLGAAGLLRGYRATAHWYVRELLTEFDCTPVNARVVVDRNRVTGSGVTAGIDMALTISAAIYGDELARRQTLAFEYAPRPPFLSGTPEMAGMLITNQVLARRRPAIDFARKIAIVARRRWTRS